MNENEIMNENEDLTEIVQVDPETSSSFSVGTVVAIGVGVAAVGFAATKLVKKITSVIKRKKQARQDKANDGVKADEHEIIDVEYTSEK